MSERTTTEALQDLLPGIPNDVTLLEVVPKLPWRYGHLLRALSKTWQRAYRSGMVYDVRVCSQATERFLLVLCEFQPNMDLPPTYAIYLYSRSEDRLWFKLPPIPGFPAGFPYDCHYVPLNGKLYVLGGSKIPSSESGMREVYVLDLTGQESRWRQCQCMQVPRLRFGVTVMDGKIFVFGGVSEGRMTYRSEKYDPKVDVWSEIQPSITDFFSNDDLYAVGHELVLFHADVDGGPFEGLRGILRRDHPNDDMAEDPFVNEDDDPSDDEAEDLFISEPDSSDELHDGTWIKMIDPDLFRDDNCHWFCTNKRHGFHEILEKEGFPYFDEAIENEELERWADLENASYYVAYDTRENKWREVKNPSIDHLNRILWMAQRMQEPVRKNWNISPYRPFPRVRTDEWPLDL